MSTTTTIMITKSPHQWHHKQQHHNCHHSQHTNSNFTRNNNNNNCHNRQQEQQQVHTSKRQLRMPRKRGGPHGDCRRRRWPSLPDCLTKTSTLISVLILVFALNCVQCKPNSNQNQNQNQNQNDQRQQQQQQQQQHQLTDKQLLRKALDSSESSRSSGTSSDSNGPAASSTTASSRNNNNNISNSNNNINNSNNNNNNNNNNNINNNNNNGDSQSTSSSVFQCPEQFGYYTDAKDCTKYYVCVFGEVLHESCTGGLRFSRELQTCDWPRNVECPAGQQQQQQADNNSTGAQPASSTPPSVGQQQATSTTASTLPSPPSSSSSSSSSSMFTSRATASSVATPSSTSTTTVSSNQIDAGGNRMKGQQQQQNQQSMAFADEASDPQQPSFDEAVSPVITADGAIHLHDGSGGTFGLGPNHNRALASSSPQSINGPLEGGALNQQQQQRQAVDVFVMPLSLNSPQGGTDQQHHHQSAAPRNSIGSSSNNNINSNRNVQSNNNNNKRQQSSLTTSGQTAAARQQQKLQANNSGNQEFNGASGNSANNNNKVLQAATLPPSLLNALQRSQQFQQQNSAVATSSGLTTQSRQQQQQQTSAPSSNRAGGSAQQPNNNFGEAAELSDESGDFNLANANEAGPSNGDGADLGSNADNSDGPQDQLDSSIGAQADQEADGQDLPSSGSNSGERAEGRSSNGASDSVNDNNNNNNGNNDEDEAINNNGDKSAGDFIDNEDSNNGGDQPSSAYVPPVLTSSNININSNSNNNNNFPSPSRQRDQEAGSRPLHQSSQLLSINNRQISDPTRRTFKPILAPPQLQLQAQPQSQAQARLISSSAPRQQQVNNNNNNNGPINLQQANNQKIQQLANSGAIPTSSNNNNKRQMTSQQQQMLAQNNRQSRMSSSFQPQTVNQVQNQNRQRPLINTFQASNSTNLLASSPKFFLPAINGNNNNQEDFVTNGGGGGRPQLISSSFNTNQKVEPAKLRLQASQQAAAAPTANGNRNNNNNNLQMPASLPPQRFSPKPAALAPINQQQQQQQASSLQRSQNNLFSGQKPAFGFTQTPGPSNSFSDQPALGNNNFNNNNLSRPVMLEQFGASGPGSSSSDRLATSQQQQQQQFFRNINHDSNTNANDQLQQGFQSSSLLQPTLQLQQQRRPRPPKRHQIPNGSAAPMGSSRRQPNALLDFDTTTTTSTSTTTMSTPINRIANDNRDNNNNFNQPETGQGVGGGATADQLDGPGAGEADERNTNLPLPVTSSGSFNLNLRDRQQPQQQDFQTSASPMRGPNSSQSFKQQPALVGSTSINFRDTSTSFSTSQPPPMTTTTTASTSTGTTRQRAGSFKPPQQQQLLQPTTSTATTQMSTANGLGPMTPLITGTPSDEGGATTTTVSSEDATGPATGTTPDPQAVANRYLNSAIDALEAGQPFGTVDYDFDILNDNSTDRRQTAGGANGVNLTLTTTTSQPPNEPLRPEVPVPESGPRSSGRTRQGGGQQQQRQQQSADELASSFGSQPPTPPLQQQTATVPTPTRKPRPTNKKIVVNHEQALANIRASTEPAKRPEAIFATPQALQVATKCDNRVCRLPDCKCGDTLNPGGLEAKAIPQVVLLTFDDAVNDLNWEIYEELFTGRTNPNGCPVLATFYVSHEWTDYGQVQTLYSRGHEMASHSVTHSFGEKFSKSQWFKEINGQREILNMYGGVKMNDVRGMRAPFLQIGGNKMFEMLYDANFTYDSSMPIFENSPPMWPYTLDYQLAHECMITPCPTKSFPGVWEVGMTMWVDLRGGRCSMGDACSNPTDEDGVYEMLMKNFNRHYKSNRAPFGLFYHSAWFNTVHHRRGFLRFMSTVNSLPDVFFVTNWQMLQWMRQPTPLSEINSFEPWQCPAKNDRPPPCFHPSVCNVKSEHGTRFMKTCQPCPANQQYPWVGATGFNKNGNKQNGSG